MSEVELDLSGAQPTRFSTHSEALAELVLELGYITPLTHAGGFRVRSLRTGQGYQVTTVQDEWGEILGHLCDCPNGRQGGVQARCYHALAAQLFIEQDHGQEQET